MVSSADISRHYTSGSLLERLRGALRDDGADPDNPTIETLTPYDQFHGRGIEATEEMAGLVKISGTDHILDVGSGLGGPARFMANRFGCRVTGIDLTPEFCEVARVLTTSLGLQGKVTIEQGDATALPFADASFEGAYSMNVVMNIADKAGFYGEMHRVLRPGAWLLLGEVAQGPNGSVDYPTPWARTADESFLATPEETRAGLEAAGFTDLKVRDTSEETKAYGARMRAMLERGEKPSHRAAQLVHGDLGAEVMANSARGVHQGRIIPVEIFCRKPQES